jgi:hypothetical protein
MKKKTVRIFATEIVQHIFSVDADKFDKEFKRLEEDGSWRVENIWKQDGYTRESCSITMEVE